MAQLIVRNLPEELKEKLRERAKSRGHSLEAEVRDILNDAIQKVGADPGLGTGINLGFGAAMHQRFRARGLTPKEHRRFERAEFDLRDRSDMSIPDFEE